MQDRAAQRPGSPTGKRSPGPATPEPCWAKYLGLAWNKSLELTDDIQVTSSTAAPPPWCWRSPWTKGRTAALAQFYADDCMEAAHARQAGAGPVDVNATPGVICTESTRWWGSKNEKVVRSRGGALQDSPAHACEHDSLYTRMESMKGLRDFFTFTN
ncbi:hypothetical protein DPEC_G00371380 [Dallia pectoralis]|nr:hypothetical protein DPEC_G00371380 [Dallia pectoralis]